MVVLRFHIHGRGDCMIERPLYLDKIMPFVDTPFVKILTGVRRCGKSTILKMIIKKIAQFKKIVAFSNLIQRIYHNDIRNMLP